MAIAPVQPNDGDMPPKMGTRQKMDEHSVREVEEPVRDQEWEKGRKPRQRRGESASGKCGPGKRHT